MKRALKTAVWRLVVLGSLAQLALAQEVAVPKPPATAANRVTVSQVQTPDGEFTKYSPEKVQIASPTNVAHVRGISLYVLESDAERRFGADAKTSVAYIKRLEHTVARVLTKSERPSAKGLLIAVGIKSKTNTLICCQAIEGDIPPAVMRRLEQELARVEAFDVQQAPVGFGLGLELFGQTPAKFPLFPDEWVDASRKTASKRLIPADDLFGAIWPD